MSYQAPGMSAAEIIAAVKRLVAPDTTDSDTLQEIYECVTQAIIAAEQHANWWFLRTSNTFDTVADTATYNLSTVNTNAMANLSRIESIWKGTERLPNRTRDEYAKYVQESSMTGSPAIYAVTAAGPTISIYPTPSAAETITVYYIRRHGKFNASSADADLIFPAEYHRSIYVDGAVWAHRHTISSPEQLYACPSFMDALRRMQSASPESNDRSNSIDNFSTYSDADYPVEVVRIQTEEALGT